MARRRVPGWERTSEHKRSPKCRRRSPPGPALGGWGWGGAEAGCVPCPCFAGLGHTAGTAGCARGTGGRAWCGLFRPGRDLITNSEERKIWAGKKVTKKFICHRAKWRHLSIFLVVLAQARELRVALGQRGGRSSALGREARGKGAPRLLLPPGRPFSR